MTIEGLVSKYVRNTKRVFKEMRITQGSVLIDEEKIKTVIETAKRYLEDAKYYQDEKKFETGLASVAYSEGLLDALRLLGAVEFSWR